MRGTAMLAGVVSRLRRPLTPAEARAALEARREHRASAFLMLLRRAVFQAPRSPYAPLLRAARCEYGDIERMVRTDGVEGTLAALFQSGVFLTVDELKGLVPVTRAGAPYWVGRERLRNPCWLVRGPEDDRARLLHAAMFRDHEVVHTLVMAAVGGLRWRHGYWGILGDAAAVALLRYAGGGMAPVDWFTHLDPREPGIDLDDRWGSLALRLAGTLAGRPMPPARYVPLDAPDPILAWIRDHLDAGRTPHLCGGTSLMVRLAVLARERGLDLTGARFTISGEPVTDRRLATIRSTGAEGYPSYATREALVIGQACRQPVASDEVHLLDDLHALALAGPRNPAGLPEDALLISSVRAGAPLVLLNVSLGDRADVSSRACGCPLETLGWRTHLATVRSFEKLTAGGGTFVDGALIRVLEETLPARFGGGPLDYQLVEEEGADGLPRVRLMVADRVGAVDTTRVMDTFRQALLQQSRSSALLWQQGRWLEVGRGSVAVTARGKVHHLVPRGWRAAAGNEHATGEGG
jgi:hypothetical protein